MKNIFEGKKNSLEFIGFITGIGALFLNIPIPEQSAAKEALANIQIFWLILFLASFIYIGVSFIKSIINYEKEIEGKYNIAAVSVFSATIGGILLWVVFNLVGYISILYAVSLSKLIIMASPGIVTELSFLLILLTKKRRRDFSLLSEFIIYSFVGASLTSFIGMYIQQAILKYFYYYWFYPIPHIIFLFSLVSLIIAAKIQKKRLLSYGIN